MRTLPSIVLFFTTLFLLAACNKQRVDKSEMDAVMGLNKDAITEKWGAPERVLDGSVVQYFHNRYDKNQKSMQPVFTRPCVPVPSFSRDDPAKAPKSVLVYSFMWGDHPMHKILYFDENDVAYFWNVYMEGN